MLKRTLSIVVALLYILGTGTAVVHAEEAPITEETDSFVTVIINEVYPNAPGSSEIGAEYVELHNPLDIPLDLTGFSLGREGSTTVHLLDGLTIESGGYLVVYPTFSLLNGGSSLFLDYPPNESNQVTSINVLYPSTDELHSWSLVGEVWQTEEPTPGSANPEPLPELPEEEPEETEEPEELPAVCALTTVFVNEILANPAGPDTEGGEFVEFYNDGTESVSLAGCLLATDKVNDLPLPPVEVGAGGYYVLALTDQLLNAGGTVVLITANDEYAVEYPELADDHVWAIVEGVWQVSDVQTPESQNQLAPEEYLPLQNQLTPCPAGKFRNPETNRCKSIVATARGLLPCKAGQTRNPLTNRCRSIIAVGSTLTPCRTGQQRNPSTNRCRAVAGSTTVLAPCKEGYERSADTNRCRKVALTLATREAPKIGPSELNNSILVVMTLLVLAYGVYEYRLDIANWYAKLRARYTKPERIV